MARSSTSFGKGNSGKPQGAKHTTTLIKEQIGMSRWDSMCDKIVNEGIDKYMEELFKLKGKDYIFGYNCLIEYVKPKLNRTTLDGNLNLNHTTIEIDL